MKKIAYITLPAMFAVFVISCGGNADSSTKDADTEQADNNDQGSDNASNDPTTNAMNEAEAKLAERRAKGDTLAMNYKDLQKYLPKIDGYTMGEPGGGTFNMPGASYSNAEATYTDDKGNTVKVQIIDYNQAYAMYAGATAMWAMGISVDTDDEKAAGVKLDDKVAGWEQFYKKSNRAIVTVGVGYRFWVQVEAENQKDTEWVKTVAKSIDLAKLSGM